MRDVRGVGMGQSGEDIPQDRDRAAQWQLAVASEPGAQRRAFHEYPGVIHERASAAAAAGRHERRRAYPINEQQELALEHLDIQSE